LFYNVTTIITSATEADKALEFVFILQNPTQDPNIGGRIIKGFINLLSFEDAAIASKLNSNESLREAACALLDVESVASEASNLIALLFD